MESIEDRLRACASRQSIADCGVVTRGREVVLGVVEILPAVVRDEGVGARGSFLEVNVGVWSEEEAG